jgi:hypothetical protein
MEPLIAVGIFVIFVCLFDSGPDHCQRGPSECQDCWVEMKSRS